MDEFGLVWQGLRPCRTNAGPSRRAGRIAQGDEFGPRGVDVEFDIGTTEVTITATVRTTDRTGVEMEALTAVSVAALTVYDMIKAVDPAARIDGVHVVRKEGGKTGTWTP